MGTANVVPVCVADIYTGAAFGGFGFDWVRALREFSASTEQMGSEGDFGRAGAGVDFAFVPADYDDWKNFRAAVGGRDRDDVLADLGRPDAFLQEDCV